MDTIEFKEWPKMPRISKEKITVSEKMDGTNACIIIKDAKIIGIQSRKRFITCIDDNYGFANWVWENAPEIINLGDGHHFGEWVGLGIQKNPHNLDAKYFYIFNTFMPIDSLPSCIRKVRVVYEGEIYEGVYKDCMDTILSMSETEGYKAEGIVSYNHLSRTRYKKTFEYDNGKWGNK